MTYCLGIKVREGLVCLSDGRITSGTQVTNAHKISLHGPSGAQLCIMTSGLRSLRDKTLAYFDRALREERPLGHKTMLEAVEDYCRYLRQVAEEDRAALQDSRLDFNLHSIVSGQMSEDPEPGLFLIYPEGNWIEVGERTPLDDDRDLLRTYELWMRTGSRRAARRLREAGIHPHEGACSRARH